VEEDIEFLFKRRVHSNWCENEKISPSS